MADSIIITAALTGSIHTPTMSPHLPVTADEMVAQAVDAADAGASIIHLHARDPESGKPSADPRHFMAFLPRVKQASDAVLNISTGGSSQMTLAERLAPALAAEPEMCSLNMGSMNFGIFPLAERYEEWKHDWERPFLVATRDVVFKNTFADIESIFCPARRGLWHPLRVRVLRHRPHSDARLFPEGRAYQAACLRAVRHGRARWHRCEPREPDGDEGDSRSPDRTSELPVLGSRSGPASDASWNNGRRPRRQCPRRARRQLDLWRGTRSCARQRASGCPDPSHP